jgi:hypothetical protein
LTLLCRFLTLLCRTAIQRRHGANICCKGTGLVPDKPEIVGQKRCFCPPISRRHSALSLLIRRPAWGKINGMETEVHIDGAAKEE